ncbi:hypothetical protein H5395_15190 [Paracoccus sp. MC1854]|uniref:hypothetical protein n=1 Tax=Paracoccus sp. MC1854 TaxID=2760306 RepID=UPI0015FF477B|nr:hypothetical protein [Paracoccus sp. MC1854]MBB1492843.1 hypothetical protein [Paracoccus sp. MC1854]
MTKIRHLGAIAVAAIAVFCATPAAADGFFLQSDIGSDTQGGVVNVQRGNLSFGANFTRYEGGKELFTSVLHAVQLGDVAVLKYGPTVGKEWDDDGDDDVRLGGRVSIERYMPTSFGSAYGLINLATVNSSWFVLAQANIQALNGGVELSRGGSDNYHETTVAFRKGFGDSPFSLRAGYKFDSEEAFLGFSLNTF